MENHDILLQNALDAVVGADSHERIIYWNFQAEKTFGWTKDEVFGKNMADLIVPERFRAAHRKGMQHFLSTGEGPILNQRIEVPALRKDGSEFACELTVSPIRKGEEINFFSFIRDISLKKEIENERARLLDEAKNSAQEAINAVHARDEFIGICSHELKTPITSLLLQLQLAEQKINSGIAGVLEPEPSLKRLDSAIHQLKRVIRLIDDMLDVSRIAIGKLHLNLTSFDLSKLVSELAERFEFQFYPSESIRAFADRDRIEQVMTNLLTNAIKYGGGKPIQVEIAHESKAVRITVTDQGNGIDAENLSRIFEKFERATPSANISGMGIGLYISRSIVEAHGGTISVTSKIGEGSTFTVILPA